MGSIRQPVTTTGDDSRLQREEKTEQSRGRGHGLLGAVDVRDPQHGARVPRFNAPAATASLVNRTAQRTSEGLIHRLPHTMPYGPRARRLQAQGPKDQGYERVERAPSRLTSVTQSSRSERSGVTEGRDGCGREEAELSGTRNRTWRPQSDRIRAMATPPVPSSMDFGFGQESPSFQPPRQLEGKMTNATHATRDPDPFVRRLRISYINGLFQDSHPHAGGLGQQSPPTRTVQP
jgi:hypothetical protein